MGTQFLKNNLFSTHIHSLLRFHERQSSFFPSACSVFFLQTFHHEYCRNKLVFVCQKISTDALKNMYLIHNLFTLKVHFRLNFFNELFYGGQNQKKLRLR